MIEIILLRLFSNILLGKRRSLKITETILCAVVIRLPDRLFKILVEWKFNLRKREKAFTENTRTNKIDWKKVRIFRKIYARHPSLALKKKAIFLGLHIEGKYIVLRCAERPYYEHWSGSDLQDVVYFNKRLGASFTPQILEITPATR